MTIRAIRDWWLLRTRVQPKVASDLASLPRPMRSGRTRVSGTDPIRALITGGGLAAGYGAPTWDDALGAAFARSFAEHTGRGIVVEQVPLPDVDAEEVRTLIADLDARSFDVLFWSPAYSDDPSRPAPDRWRVGLHGIAHALRTGACGCKGHVLLGVPELHGREHGDIINARIREANEEIVAIAAALPRTQAVIPPPIARAAHLGPKYYEQCAPTLAAATIAALRGEGPAPA